MTERPDKQQTKPEPDRTLRIVHAEALFQGKREIYLELDGVRYRLRITRRNKLVLQK